MKLFNEIFANQAHELHAEILADHANDWFHPVADHKIFDQAYMKFMNRNLNYYSFKNMVAHAVEENPEYNTNLPKAREFCEYLRGVVGEYGPFGRMCIWRVPPGLRIMPHRDIFLYHRHITRYVLSLSDQTSNAEISIAMNNVPVFPGLLFNFYPAFELHTFVNYSESDWYFLVCDYWKLDMLKSALSEIDVDEVNNNPARTASFGWREEKYQSKH